MRLTMVICDKPRELEGGNVHERTILTLE